MQAFFFLEISSNGMLTEGQEFKNIDCIVFSTGFEAIKLTYSCKGKNGKTFEENCEQVPKAYYGISHPEFPNYF